MRPFRRIVIAALTENPDLELFRYGARAAARTAGECTVLVTGSGVGMLRKCGTAVQRCFDLEGAAAPEYRVIADASIDSLVSIADECDADVLLLRQDGTGQRSRRQSRRLLAEAQCSVWLLPVHYSDRISTVLAEFSGDITSPAVLETCAKICRAFHADKLIAGKIWTLQSAFKLQDEEDNLRADAWDTLHRLFERVPLHDVPCTLQMEDAGSISRGLLKIADGERADLLAIAAPAYSFGDHGQRETIDDYLRSTVPLLSLRVTPGNWNIGLAFREYQNRFEPLFN